MRNKNRLCRLCGRAVEPGLIYCNVHKETGPWYQKYPVIYRRKKGHKNKWSLKGDKRWKKMSAVYLANNYICVACEIAPAVAVDHILPVSRYPEKRYDKTNFQSLCKSCHSIKTTRYESRGLYPDYNVDPVDVMMETFPDKRNNK